MANVQVQFIINQFAVNHIVQNANVEEVRKQFLDEWKDRQAIDDVWVIEDTAFKPSAVTMLRVFEHQEEKVVEDGAQ